MSWLEIWVQVTKASWTVMWIREACVSPGSTSTNWGGFEFSLLGAQILARWRLPSCIMAGGMLHWGRVRLSAGEGTLAKSFGSPSPPHLMHPENRENAQHNSIILERYSPYFGCNCKALSLSCLSIKNDCTLSPWTSQWQLGPDELKTLLRQSIFQ